MKIVVVLGHPNKGSFNHAIAETAVDGCCDPMGMRWSFTISMPRASIRS